MTQLELTGLKGHHPLGFLAACGLLRITAAPLDIRLSWQGVPNNPSERVAVVFSERIRDRDELRQSLFASVADAALRYLKVLDEIALATDQPSPSDIRQIGRALIGGSDFELDRALEVGAILSFIGSDLVTSTSDDKKIERSKLVMTTATRDLFKPAGLQSAKDLSKRNKQKQPTPGVVAHIEEALFGPWRYQDDAHPQGLDPSFQRFHALRNREPTNDRKHRSVTTAVFLALQALTLFPCFSIRGKLYTTAVRRRGGAEFFEWPLWGTPISLYTVRSLLSSDPDAGIFDRGVDVLYRSERVGIPTAGGITHYLSQAQEWMPDAK